jgi:quercetin dioxygenase-like cupin family protein
MGIYVGPGDGLLTGTSTVIKVSSEQTGGALAVVETTLAPKSLIEQHVHANDVWIYVLAGEVGVLVGDEIAGGGQGSWLLKPRDIPHAMWNAASVPARVMEVLTPAGTEGYFLEGSAMESREAFEEMAARYGIRFQRDAAWNDELRRRFRLA